MKVTPPLFKRFLFCLPVLGALVFLCPAQASADTVFDFTLDILPSQFHFTGSYSVNTASLDSALARSAAATVLIDSFTISNWGTQFYSGPAFAGSELDFVAGGTGTFNWAIWGPGLSLFYFSIKARMAT
jgi:hypothetical protein